MTNKTVIGIIVVVILVIAIVGGYAVYSGVFNPTPSPSPSPSPTATPTPTASPTPEVSTAQEARDSVMTYIKTNHNETAQYLQSFNWTGGKVDQGLLVGSVLYSYMSQAWNVTVRYPVVPNPIYSVNVDYNVGSVAIFWEGTWQSGNINETIYNNFDSSSVTVQQGIRNEIVNYLRVNHTETLQYLQNYAWTGGRTTPSGIVGAETYSYVNQGWNVTIEYPVVLNPTYTLSANYTNGSVAISWSAVLQHTNITEIIYTNNQLSPQQQVRNDIVNYLRIYHIETVQYLQDYNWLESNQGLPGSSTYTYLNLGWNITMQYPVVLNPLYTITANYTTQATPPQTIILWQGTWQNGTSTETSYHYTP